MDKQDVVHPYNKILCSLKAGNSDTLQHKPRGHYAKWNKIVTEEQIL